MSQRKKSKKDNFNSGIPTQQPSFSPSLKQSNRSPFSSSKFNIASNIKNNVSYGELQIVLDNIQEIRKKAKQQIQSLTIENQSLKEEISKLYTIIQELKNCIEKNDSAKSQVEVKLKWKLDEQQKQKYMLAGKVKDKDKVIVQLQNKIKDLEVRLTVQNENCSLANKEITQWKKKWKWAFEILAGDTERSEQLVWKVKSECKHGIWEVLLSQAQLIHERDLKDDKISILQKEQVELKNQNKQSTRLLEQSINLSNSLKEKIDKYEQKLKINQQNSKNQILELTKIQNLLKSSQKDGHQWQNKASQLQKSFNFDKQQLSKQISNLQNQLQNKDFLIAQHKKKQQYEILISEICQQSEDYSQLLERVRYLQKFRSQYYFNIEKIQYLCKMLDQ